MSVIIEPKAIQREASTLALSELATYMSAVFGWQLLGFMLGADHPKDQPLQEAFMAEPEVQRRMRSAYQAARVLETAYGNDMARSWFLGENSRLGATAPVVIVRDASGEQKLSDVVDAAYTFVGPAF